MKNLITLSAALAALSSCLYYPVSAPETGEPNSYLSVSADGGLPSAREIKRGKKSARVLSGIPNDAKPSAGMVKVMILEREQANNFKRNYRNLIKEAKEEGLRCIRETQGDTQDCRDFIKRETEKYEGVLERACENNENYC